jgi:hypothetical protein
LVVVSTEEVVVATLMEGRSPKFFVNSIVVTCGEPAEGGAHACAPAKVTTTSTTVEIARTAASNIARFADSEILVVV